MPDATTAVVARHAERVVFLNLSHSLPLINCRDRRLLNSALIVLLRHNARRN